jgi:hypothetical protein
MTEAEWLSCNDPMRMVAFLGEGASDRKLRLFILACLRLLDDPLGTLDVNFEELEQCAEDPKTRARVEDFLDEDLSFNEGPPLVRFLFRDSAWAGARSVCQEVLSAQEQRVAEEIEEELRLEVQQIGDDAAAPVWAGVLADHFERSYRARVAYDTGTFRGLAYQEAWAAAKRKMMAGRNTEVGAFREWWQLARDAEEAVKDAARGAAGKFGDAAGHQVGHAVFVAFETAARDASQAAEEAERAALAEGAAAHQQRRENTLQLARERTRKEQSRLLREIFGNPLRPAPTIDPFWLVWNGGTIPQLAAMIDEENDFDKLTILGDALEDSGCTDRWLLDHCRQREAHVRGCWVLDLLAGRHP